VWKRVGKELCLKYFGSNTKDGPAKEMEKENP
jgi:hypothetical protein